MNLNNFLLFVVPFIIAAGLLYLMYKFTEDEVNLFEVKGVVPFHLELVSLGNFPHCGKHYDLRDYFVDKRGKLYSRNGSSWEILPNKGRDILICSDNSTTKYGTVINTLRDRYGNKVTIARERLDFYSLVADNESKILKVLQHGDRHLTITKVG